MSLFFRRWICKKAAIWGEGYIFIVSHWIHMQYAHLMQFSTCQFNLGPESQAGFFFSYASSPIREILLLKWCPLSHPVNLEATSHGLVQVKVRTSSEASWIARCQCGNSLAHQLFISDDGPWEGKNPAWVSEPSVSWQSAESIFLLKKWAHVIWNQWDTNMEPRVPLLQRRLGMNWVFAKGAALRALERGLLCLPQKS